MGKGINNSSNGGSSRSRSNGGNSSSCSSNDGHEHEHTRRQQLQQQHQQQMYVVRVSKRFLITSALISILLSYGAGRACRLIAFHVDSGRNELGQLYGDGNDHLNINMNLANGNGNNKNGHIKALDSPSSTSSSSSSSSSSLSSLPNPRLMDGKVAPHTLYTAKNFDTAASVTTSSVHLQQDVTANVNAHTNAVKDEDVCEKTNSNANANDANSTNKEKVASGNGEEQSQSQSQHTTSDPESDSNSDSESDLHLPAGQHLLVDIKNVDSSFLNSEHRLAHAMVNVVNESKLTLLSYHCHSLVPTGVSCVGVLLESHVSFHTWPTEGVITLDLFTCGSGELVPVLPLIERGFAIPQQQQQQQNETYAGVGTDADADTEFDPPIVVWSHKLRGFRNDAARHSSVWSNDLGKMVVEVSHLDMKIEVASTQTPFQRIHIYDTIDATKRDIYSYYKSLSGDGSYENLHPELYKPDRIVFLEGVLQSTRLGNEAYHEALVQPAMFAHIHPKRVGIIGGGEGATLREVLKHKSLEKVVMIEIDEEMVYFSKEYLPDWNDCSDLVGSADWCGDDVRADLRYEDGAAWFNDRFSDNRIDREEYREDPFDVLIMDALDPQDDIPFADLLYTDLSFLKSLYDSLSHDGIIVMQLGGAPNISSPPENVALNAKRGVLTQILSKAGFKSIHIFEESHCGFHAPWSFLVAMKSEVSRKRWYRVGAEVDIDIHQRILRTHSGKPALKHFDGAMMTSYQLPSKAFESVYCKATPTPESCVELDGNVNEESKKEVKEIRSQSVRRNRQNTFDMYLDRHTYEKNKSGEGESKNIFCDYFYYNEHRLKHNIAIDYENIRKLCEN